MATVTADFQSRGSIHFQARGRTAINDRSPAPDGDGPIGFTSTELLLVAVGNCMLGTLLGAPLLANLDIPHAIATLNATMASEPLRIVRIEAEIELQTADLPEGPFDDGLTSVACECPMCNSLSAERTVRLHVTYPR